MLFKLDPMLFFGPNESKEFKAVPIKKDLNPFLKEGFVVSETNKSQYILSRPAKTNVFCSYQDDLNKNTIIRNGNKKIYVSISPNENNRTKRVYISDNFLSQFGSYLIKTQKKEFSKKEVISELKTYIVNNNILIVFDSDNNQISYFMNK